MRYRCIKTEHTKWFTVGKVYDFNVLKAAGDTTVIDELNYGWSLTVEEFYPNVIFRVQSLSDYYEQLQTGAKG